MYEWVRSQVWGIGCSMTKGLLAWGEIRLRLGEEQRKDIGDSH